MKQAAIAGAGAVAAPSIGPAIVTLFGLDIPILAAGLSIAGLLLARLIAKPTKRKLNMGQEMALTALLCIFCILLVSGSFGTGRAGEGLAFAWGVGIGLSGLAFLELFGDAFISWARRFVNALFNQPQPPAQ